MKNYNFIEIYDNIFSISDDVIEYFENNVDKHVKRSKDQQSAGIIDESLYLTYDKSDPTTNNILIEIDSCIREGFQKYIEKYEKCYFNYRALQQYRVPTFKIQKSKPGEGFNAWHQEKCYIIDENYTTYYDYQRFMVYTIYLNDIKEDGETEFYYQNIKVKAKKGRLCLFPADFPFVHRGVPPKNETKYIITGWLHDNVINYKSVL